MLINAVDAEIEIRRRAADPNKAWDRFLVPADPVEWIVEHFRIPETADHKLVLGDYQRAVLSRVLKEDNAGDFPYSIIVWGDIKKSIKSCIAAGVVLWMCWHKPWSSVKIVANDLKQADSRVSYYVRRAIQLNPDMAKFVKVKPSGYTVDFPNNSHIEAIPVDPSGEAGGNDDMIVFSELWAAKNDLAKRMWTEMTLSPTKMGKSFRWVETYAGFDGESPLLEQLYHQGVKEGFAPEWAWDIVPPLPVFENLPARLILMWNDEPRLPWQTHAYYAQEEAVLTPSEFSRVHRNQWAGSNQAFVPIEWWDACLHREITPNKDESMVIAMDAAVSNDLFAVVGVAGVDGENYRVAYSNAWKARKGHKIDFDEVRSEVVRLLNEHNVIEVAYDPYQLEDMAGHLKRELIAHVHTFNQAGPRLIADKGLFDSIRDKHIWHGGDIDLREHVMNSNAKQDQGRLRLVKRNELLKIDLAVALSMALQRAKDWKI